jgi:hypothetical protein
MRRLAHFLFGRKCALYGFESDVIQSIKASLAPGAASQLQRQVDSINKVQRLTQGKEVNLYHMNRGRVAFDDRLRFPGLQSEALLATARLVHPDRAATVKVDAWLANGRLFSLIFDKPPQQFFVGHSMDSIRPRVADVRIWFDPTKAPARFTEAPLDPAALVGWLGELRASCRLTEARIPLSRSERDSLIARVDALLPPEYFEVVEQAEGVKVGDCEIHGLAAIRKVSLPSDNYYILAENSRGGLAVKAGCKTADIYLLLYDRDEVRLLDHSFRRAVFELCCGDGTVSRSGKVQPG